MSFLATAIAMIGSLHFSLAIQDPRFSLALGHESSGLTKAQPSPRRLQEDTTPPSVTSIELSATVADTTSGPVSIQVQAIVVDDRSGVDGVSLDLWFYSPSRTQNVYTQLQLLGGDYYTGTVTFPPHCEGGSWTLEPMYIADRAGNYQTFSSPTTVLVTSQGNDASPPELLHLSFSAATGDTTYGSLSIDITAIAVDDLSGIDDGGLDLRFSSPSHNQSVHAKLSLTDPTNSTYYTGSATFPEHCEEGLWTLNPININDRVGNSARIEIPDMEGNNFPTTVAIGPSYSDWYVAYKSAKATIDGTTNPDIFLSYSGPAPAGTDRYYKVSVMNHNCTSYNVPDNATITPFDAGGIIPDDQFDPATSTITARLDIDIKTIIGSVFYIPGPSQEVFAIELCVGMDLYNEKGVWTATQKTILTLNVDTTVTFEITDFQASPESSTFLNMNILVNFPIKGFMCHENNTEMPPTYIEPGEIIRFCIHSDSPEARVVDIGYMALENTLDSTGLEIPLVDARGAPSNLKVAKTCANGLCSVETVSLARMYEEPLTEEDSTRQGRMRDISSGNKVVGTAILEFVSSGRRLAVPLPEGNDHAAANFEWDLLLAPPSSASTLSCWAVAGMVVVVGMVVG